MSTIYLLDALFILILGMTALFAFSMSACRTRTALQAIFFISLALFLFTLYLGHWVTPQESTLPAAR
jgi:hypothetical protein